MTTLEDHLAQSQRFYAARDVQGALTHLAKAFAIDPFDTPALQLAYQMMPTIPNLVAITAPGDRTPREMVALHAMALGLAHDWTRAIALLFQLGADDPKTPYLMWADHWQGTHPSAVLVDLAVVGPSLARFADTFEDPIETTSPWYESLTAGTHVVQRWADTFAQNKALRTIHLKLLRRAKRYDDALAIAARAKAADPHFGTMLTAWTYRDMGRFDDAIAAFREAYTRAPDVDVILDVGDIQLNLGRFEAAVETYAHVPASAERYAWAHPSRLAAQFLATRDAGVDRELASLAQAGNERAKQVYALVHAYAEVQPSPRDLTCGIVRSIHAQFRSQPGQGTPSQPAVLGIDLTSIESPSVRLAFELACRTTNSHARMDVTPQKEAKPDPRAPLMTAIGRGADAIYQQFPIWVYEGAKPRVNAPAPPAGIVDAVAELAATRFDWASWQASAATRGPSLRGQSVGLVCALVHPPAPRDPAADLVEWVWHYQLAGALLLARLDGGWASSERRGGLLALVHGPIDWLVSAALPALGLVYAECAEARPELGQIFAALRQRVPDIGYACHRAALEAITFRLPDVDEATRRAAWARLVTATDKPYLG